MGVKRSEYRRSFVKTPDNFLAQDFESKFDYRLTRRSTEHSHTPFEWDYTSEDDSDYDPISQVVGLEKLRLEEDENQKLAEKRRKEEEDERNRRKERSRESLEADGNRRHRRRAHREHENEQQLQERPRDGSRKTKSRATQSAARNQRPRRPLKPNMHKPLPKPRPLEGSSKRRGRQEASREEGPGMERQSPSRSSKPVYREPVALFVPFGNADKERETGALKTHNVKSTADVYPSALRARKRLELDVERREERARTRPYLMAADLEASRPRKKDISPWDSEYRDHYQSYEPGQYRRSRPAGGEPCRFYVPL